MATEKLKTIAVAMIVGGAFGGVAGTLEGATLLGMVIGAAAGAAEVTCLECGCTLVEVAKMKKLKIALAMIMGGVFGGVAGTLEGAALLGMVIGAAGGAAEVTCLENARTVVELARMKMEKLKKIDVAMIVGGTFGGVAGTLEGATLLGMVIGAAAGAAEVICLECGYKYTVPARTLVEVARMKMEKLKKIDVAMIVGGAFGGVAGTLEGATLLGMVIGAAAGAAEVICLECGYKYMVLLARTLVEVARMKMEKLKKIAVAMIVGGAFGGVAGTLEGATLLVMVIGAAAGAAEVICLESGYKYTVPARTLVEVARMKMEKLKKIDVAMIVGGAFGGVAGALEGATLLGMVIGAAAGAAEVICLECGYKYTVPARTLVEVARMKMEKLKKIDVAMIVGGAFGGVAGTLEGATLLGMVIGAAAGAAEVICLECGYKYMVLLARTLVEVARMKMEKLKKIAVAMIVGGAFGGVAGTLEGATLLVMVIGAAAGAAEVICLESGYKYTVPARTLVEVARMKMEKLKKIDVAMIVGGAFGGVAGALEGATLLGMVIGAAAGAAEVICLECGYKYTVLPARTLVEVANMKMEKLKMIAMAMIMGGTFGGVAGTLEGATLLGMVIGAAAGAAEVTCLENVLPAHTLVELANMKMEKLKKIAVAIFMGGVFGGVAGTLEGAALLGMVIGAAAGAAEVTCLECVLSARTLVEVANMKTVNLKKIAVAMIVGGAFGGVAGTLEGAALLGMVIGAAAGAAEVTCLECVLSARTLVEVANMKMEKLKKIAMAMIVGGAFGGLAGTLEGATLLGMVIGAAAGAAEVTCLESVLPARTLVEVANMKMEKLKKIAVAMIVGGAFGGVAGTLEGATLLGMVIGTAAGAAEVMCLECAMDTLHDANEVENKVMERYAVSVVVGGALGGVAGLFHGAALLGIIEGAAAGTIVFWIDQNNAEFLPHTLVVVERKLKLPSKVQPPSWDKVCLVLEEQCLVTSTSHTIGRLSCGFQLDIPEHSLPPEMSQHSVKVKQYQPDSKHFPIPNDTKPVSGVFHIELPFQLQKPATFHFEHGIDYEYCSSIHVLQMEATGHQLKEITDCVKITETHVEITVKEEIAVTTVVEKTKGKLCYSGLVYRETKDSKTHNFHFIVVSSLRIEEVDQLYHKKPGSECLGSVDVKFSRGSREIFLNIPREGITYNSWKITPSSHPLKIRQSAAGELTGDPPSCTLVAQWEGASEVQQLSYLVKLSGTNTPKFFYISSPVHTDIVEPVAQYHSGLPMEVAFSFDTTGSMREVLDQVRSEIAKLVTQLKKHIPGIRIAIIAHGDYWDECIYVTKIKDFSSDAESICDFVKKVKATHGVDGDECYELVLHEARVCLSWTPGTQRFLAMIGDAKPHDVDYPMNKQKLDWRKEAEELYDKMGVKVLTIQARDISAATPFYEELARLTRGHYLKLNEIEHIMTLLECVMHRARSVEHLKGLMDRETGTSSCQVKQQDFNGDCATMSELIIFRGLTAKINIPRDIGTKCYDFGKKILEDTTGEEMESIRSKYSDAPEQINRMVLELWLMGKGKQPATWGTLIEVLKVIDLTDLAKEIEAVKSHS